PHSKAFFQGSDDGKSSLPTEGRSPMERIETTSPECPARATRPRRGSLRRRTVLPLIASCLESGNGLHWNSATRVSPSQMHVGRQLSNEIPWHKRRAGPGHGNRTLHW